MQIPISDLIDRGLSQNEIGKICGLSQSTISRLLSGKTKSIRWEKGEKLLRAIADIKRIQPTKERKAVRKVNAPRKAYSLLKDDSHD